MQRDILLFHSGGHPGLVFVEAAGVGYEIFCSTLTLKKLQSGKTAKLFTHLYLADGIQALYGFADEGEYEAPRIKPGEAITGLIEKLKSRGDSNKKQ